MELGVTFSQAIDIYRQTNDSNIFEDVITLQAIEEDPNLSLEQKQKLVDLINSDAPKFEKRLKVMRALDKSKDFSTNIALILKEKPSKMEMVKKILYVFRDHYIKNDVLKKEFGEVLTSLETVSDMISEIEEEFWTTPFNDDGSIKKILEPANGSGIFSWVVIVKFMKGLENFITNEDERYKFIVENMIYVCELQKSKMFNWLCIIDLFDEYKVNAYCGSFLEEGFDNHMKEVWGLNPGDISLCLSNPPYQEMDGGAKASAKPIYNLFTLKSIKLSNRILFITPSRWFAGGKGLDSFRKMMMQSKKIKTIKHFEDASKIFGKNVDITGGVSYFLYDNSYFGHCELNNSIIDLNKSDIIVTNVKIFELISKFDNIQNLSLICMGRGDNTFGIQTNDKRVSNIKLNNYIKCYMSKNKGFEKWIDISNVKRHDKINTYKVITAEANGSYPRFGNKFIGKPSEVCSGSYIWFTLPSKEECLSLISYLETSFCNKLLSFRKISQHIKPDTLKWIPIVPFDREWTDEMLFKYFDLSEEEKKLILEK